MAFRISPIAFRFSSTAFCFPRNPRKSIYGKKYTKDRYLSFIFFATRSLSFVITDKQCLRDYPTHNSSISGMGEPVPAIRVINEKRKLLIMVGINMMLSCGKEYVKLAWEFICKPGRENLDLLQVKKSEMTGKTKNMICIEVLCILEKHC